MIYAFRLLDLGYPIFYCHRLKDGALGLLALLLLELLDVDVLPEQQRGKAQRDEASTGNDHVPLDDAIALDDSLTRGATAGCLHDRRQVAIELEDLVLHVGGQRLGDLVRQDVGPDASCNGLADGRADGSEKAKHGDGDGDLLVVDLGHDGQLGGHGPDASGKAVEELAHDQDTNIAVRCSELNEQGGSQDREGDAGNGQPLVVTSVADKAESS